MAEPQGLNIPAIITSGVVGTILTMTVVEGVRAYYNRTEAEVEAASWNYSAGRVVDAIRVEQTRQLDQGIVPINEAMKIVVQTGGKLPATK